MFFELRKYYIQKGQKDSWIKYMEKTIMPFQISKGMVITGTFTSKNDKGEELYIWLRRFNSEKEEKRQSEVKNSAKKDLTYTIDFSIMCIVKLSK